MSNLDMTSALIEGHGNEAGHAGVGNSGTILLEPRRVILSTRTGVTIARTLPHKELRRIGAWVFLDAYGPTIDSGAMQVAAHPHTGLQTVTWLLSGAVLHHDSLGTRSVIRSGELNLMTAGFGIAHSELSLQESELLQGVQLWIALPDAVRDQAPHFEHYQDLPSFQYEDAEITLFMGELLGHKSPAVTYSPLVGAQISIRSGSAILALDPKWEHGLQVVTGEVIINGIRVSKDQLFYLPTGTRQLEISVADLAQLILIGGEPFTERIVMWWNFIARSHEEIVAMRSAWESESKRFPAFSDSFDDRIPAPEMPNLRLSPR